MEKLKLLLGGSPCTHWSIAQTKGRETEPSGIGWELFLNYRIARDKYQPDYFLYENNKSMSPAIKAQITKELGVEPVLINSALVSAQSRQRLYWFGKRNQDGTYSRLDVEQPEDRGILLRDVLESGIAYKEKSYLLKASTGGGCFENDFLKSRMTHVAEPVSIRLRGRDVSTWESRSDYKSGALDTNGARSGVIAEPVRIGTVESDVQNANFDSQQYRVYSLNGKSVTLCGNGGGVGAKTGLYAVPTDVAMYQIPRGYNKGGIKHDKSPTLTANGDWAHNNFVIVAADGKTRPVYCVQNGQITIKKKQYPIKLADGYYIIRKLTVTECKRLQTVPEDYIFPVSDTQAYKMLGNGWTVDVITHILSHIPDLSAESVEVLSMYDGMSCGHIALDKLRANVVRYYATEIDKYAVQTTMTNYPDTVQLGDAFGVRDSEWAL